MRVELETDAKVRVRMRIYLDRVSKRYTECHIPLVQGIECHKSTSAKSKAKTVPENRFKSLKNIKIVHSLV